MSATRWTTRVKAADIIFDKTLELRKTLEILQNDETVSADTKSRIQGILKKQFSLLEMLFKLNVTRKLIILLEKFSKELQAVDISADYALYSLRHILERLGQMRSNDEFELILSEAKNVPGVQEDRSERGQRKIPRWMGQEENMLTETIPTTRNQNDIDGMRRSYYEAIDVIIRSINERFEQDDLALLMTIEQILVRWKEVSQLMT